MKLTTFAFILGLPLVLAAAAASFTYAWNTFADQSPPVYAAGGGGADTNEGFVVTTMLSDSGREYLIVYDYAEYMGDGQKRPFLTTYELVRKGNGEAELYLVGSRCIEWDRGFPMVGYSNKKIESPDAMKRAQRKDDEEEDNSDD
jgi:hypothetical protein